MDNLEPIDSISKHLGIKLISHGQVDIRQIVIPESTAKEVSPERDHELSTSLSKRGSNLIPLIIRRNQAYSESEDYEIVYGADWCLAAKKLGIKTLWAWVFDLTDEQATAVKAEMERLAGATNTLLETESETTRETVEKLERSLDSELESLEGKIQQIINSFNDRLKTVVELRSRIRPPKTIYSKKTVVELRAIASKRKMTGYSTMKKANLVKALEKYDLNHK